VCHDFGVMDRRQDRARQQDSDEDHEYAINLASPCRGQYDHCHHWDESRPGRQGGTDRKTHALSLRSKRRESARLVCWCDMRGLAESGQVSVAALTYCSRAGDC
jgi:hypothetical protein